MKKDSKMICISQKKACITGLILSLVFALIGSYIGAYMMIEAGLGNGKVNVFNLGIILIPILFIVFEMLILGFIAICSGQNDK